MKHSKNDGNHWFYNNEKKKVSVYIASSYSIGDHVKNVQVSFRAYKELFELGFMPFAPLTGHYLDMTCKFTYEQWLEIDFYWLSKADCLLRLEGESLGADREVEYAQENNIPVFYSIDELKIYYGVE